jgi:hypothetical protein
VAVDLEYEIFLAVQVLGLSPGPAGASAFRGIERDDVQILMIRKCTGSPVVRIVFGQLKADSKAQAFWLGCPFNQVLKRGR